MPNFDFPKNVWERSGAMGRWTPVRKSISNNNSKFVFNHEVSKKNDLLNNFLETENENETENGF